MPDNENASAKIDILDRYRAIVKAYAQADEAIRLEQDKKKVLEGQAHDCHAAARVFGFDIHMELAIQDQSSPAPTIAKQAAALPKPHSQSIREIVLEEIKSAHPASLRASALRGKIERRRGEPIHEKTVGMTLYRLLKEGKVRRNNWEWFYVDQPVLKGVFD